MDIIVVPEMPDHYQFSKVKKLYKISKDLSKSPGMLTFATFEDSED